MVFIPLFKDVNLSENDLPLDIYKIVFKGDKTVTFCFSARQNINLEKDFDRENISRWSHHFAGNSPEETQMVMVNFDNVLYMNHYHKSDLNFDELT